MSFTTYLAQRALRAVTPTGFTKRALLVGEFFENRPPFWAGAPSTATAEAQAQQLVRRLLRKPIYDTYQTAASVAERITHCSGTTRCGVCPKCARALQLALVGRGLKLAAATDRGLELFSFTFIPAFGRVGPGNLDGNALATVAAALFHGLASAPGIEWAQGGIDVSFNDDTQKTGRSAWQVHAHGVCATSAPHDLRDSLSSQAGRSVEIYRPVMVTPTNASAYALSYSCKTKFYRRETYWDLNRDVPCWATSHRRLLAWQHAELLLAQAECRPSDRIIFHSTRS